MTNILTDIPEKLLEKVDEKYPKKGYKNRSEFVRACLRAAVEG